MTKQDKHEQLDEITVSKSERRRLEIMTDDFSDEKFEDFVEKRKKENKPL